MKIYLARHGDADVHENDSLRELSESGRSEVASLSNYLVPQHIEVAHIFHSAKLRAKQTAEILSHFFQCDQAPQQISGLNPNDSVAEMAYEINSWDNDTLLVGHLPFMAKLLAKLLFNDEYKLFTEFKTGSIACLEHHDDVWLLNWLIEPR